MYHDTQGREIEDAEADAQKRDTSPLIQIYNMHGPTVWFSNEWKDVPSLIERADWLNRAGSNAGKYPLIITICGRLFEMKELE